MKDRQEAEAAIAAALTDGDIEGAWRILDDADRRRLLRPRVRKQLSRTIRAAAGKDVVVHA